jgi:Ca-activated chloride channel family protein
MTRTDGRVDGIALHTTNPADRVALRGVRVLARLAGMSQRTTVEQTFVNLEDRAIEAVYTFPLPESAAVCGFEVVTAARVLTGRVEEAEQAIEHYERAIDEGNGAFMMEQDRPDVFTVRVGNLKPRQAATIRLTYVCSLEKSDRSIRVAFPSTIAPRYATATATDPVEAMLDGDALNPPHVLSVPYGLTLRAEIDLGRELTHVSSPSHAISVARDGDGPTIVSLSAGVTEMDRDLVLRLDLKKEHEPRVEVAAGRAGESYLAVTFLPEFDDESDLGNPPPAETVFVLDCSGSMMGESIAQAKAALELCLRSLSPGDTFNVCRFGSRFELLASEPLPYSQGTLDAALDYVAGSRDLGGTELYHPLEAILTVPPRAGTVRQIVLLTDGQVTNEPAVVELARRHRGTNRIFSFGIGTACSAFLVRGVARATGGAAEFIAPGERIDDKVLRTFSRLNSPMVGDVSIDWDGCEVQTLAELPPVFDGDVLAVFGRAPGRLPKQVTLSCTTAAGPRSWTVPLPRRAAPADDAGVIATMWARRMIQSLEEVNGLRTLRTRNAKPSREQEMLVNLSKEFGLLCSLTTFIAVEHRSPEERNEGRPELRRIPVQLARGWGGISQAAAGAGRGIRGARYRAADARVSLHDSSAGESLLDLTRASDDTRFGAAFSEALPMSTANEGAAWESALAELESVGPTPPTAAAPQAPPGFIGRRLLKRRASATASAPAQTGNGGRGLTELLNLQAADGGFEHGGPIVELLAQAGRGWDAVRPVVENLLAGVARQSKFDAERLARTLVVRSLFRQCFADRASLWRRADKKSARYLARELGTTVQIIEALQSQIASAILPTPG